jgi:hypothetical protein
MRRDAAALVAYIEARADWAFGYGRAPQTHDCARFAGGGVEAATGINPLDAFAAQWSTARGAARVLRRAGGMAAAVDSVMDPIDLTAGQRGDVAMTADGALMLVEGPTLVGPAAPNGQHRVARAHAVRMWRARG